MTVRFGKLSKFIIITIFLSPLIAGAQEQFSSKDAFLKTILKGEDRVDVEATGDLNGDGIADWAGVVHRPKPAFGSTSQLYVLLRVPQSGYRLAETSREEQIAGMGCCWTEDLRISRSSIYIQNNAKTAVTMEAATHQFKLYQGEWRLVGVRIFYLDNSKDVSTDTDMNLLTGAVIEKKQRGSRKPIVKRWTRKFGRHLLKDFDFFNGYGVE